MTTVALILVIYIALVASALALLNAAKRGDEAMDRAVADELASWSDPAPAHPYRGRVRWATPVEILPDHEMLGGVAAEVRAVLGVEQVTVALADGQYRDTGIVGACINAPGLLGERVPIEAMADTGFLPPEEAEDLGLTGDTPGGASWTYAHVPLHGPAGVSGAVTVTARRMLPFTTGEIRQIERVARRGAPQFERRRNVRTAA
jgi:hypothetical protein